MKNNVAGKPGLDPTLPDVELVLRGQSFHLAFDFNAICHAEKLTGLNLLTAIVTDISASQLRALLWSAILKDNSGFTIDEVGSWITAHNAPTIHKALVAAWFGSISKDDDEGEEEAQESV